MIHGLLVGLVIFAVFATYLLSGVDFYETREGMHGPLGFYAATAFALLTALGVFTLRSARLARARQWPYTLGVIEDIETKTAGWRLAYRYRVNDTPYRNDIFSLTTPLARPIDIALHITHTPRVSAEALLDRQVRVFYDPADASHAVLSLKDEPSPWILAIPVGVSLGGCALMAYIMGAAWL